MRIVTKPVSACCATVKLEPTWTSTLREQQEADCDLKVVIGWKEAGREKPSWEDVFSRSCVIKTLWSLLFRNSVLCRKWESDGGDEMIDHVILSESLRRTAFEAYHIHTTTSHRGVRKTLSALRSRFYLPGLTSAV